MFAPVFLALRNMGTRRGRTALTVVGIILGVAVVLAIQITNQTTLDSLRQVFDRATGQANLVVVPLDENGEAMSMGLLERVENAEGVVVAAPSLHTRTLLASEARSWQIAFSFTGLASGNMLDLYGIDPQKDPQVRVYVLAAGRLPEDEKYEAAIPEKFASEHDLQIGEELVILVPEGTERLEIVGVLANEGVSLLNDGAVAFTPILVVQDLFDRGDELDEISLQVTQKISQSPGALETLKEDLGKRVGKDGQVIYPAARGQLVSQMLATYQIGLTFFSIIAIFVGAFLIYNAFSMTVVERTREIGMLRAIGMARRHTLGMVLAEAGLLSLIGSALGVGLGILLARGLVSLLGDLVTGGEAAISIPWQGLVQSIAVGIGVTLVASLLPATQAARISPLEALRVRGRSSQQARPILWLSGLVLIFVGWAVVYQMAWRPEVVFVAGNFALVCIFLGFTLTVPLAVEGLEGLTRPVAILLYGNEGAIGSSNVRRSVGRTTLTVASLMVALTMIISIASLAHSFEQDMSSWVETALGGDLYVRSAVLMRENFASQLGTVPGVEVVTPSRTLAVRAAPGTLVSDTEVNDAFYFNAVQPSSYLKIADMQFAANQGDSKNNWARLSQGKAVFISTVVAERYHLSQGDEIILLTNRGAQAFSVAAEVLDFGGQGQMLYGTYDDIHRWFSEQGVDRFTISIAPGYSIEEVSHEIEVRYQDRQHVSLQTTEAFRRSVLDLMNQAFQLFDVLNLIGVIIGALGVINTLTMNVIERQREIGGLRSLGMTRGQVLRMVLAEALALGGMGCIYGLVVGYVLAHFLIRGSNVLIGYDLVYQFTPDPFIISALISLVVVQVAAISPARRAARVSIVESIKHE